MFCFCTRRFHAAAATIDAAAAESASHNPRRSLHNQVATMGHQAKLWEQGSNADCVLTRRSNYPRPVQENFEKNRKKPDEKPDFEILESRNP